jgi:hypothetical protein
VNDKIIKVELEVSRSSQVEMQSNENSEERKSPMLVLERALTLEKLANDEFRSVSLWKPVMARGVGQ